MRGYIMFKLNAAARLKVTADTRTSMVSSLESKLTEDGIKYDKEKRTIGGYECVVLHVGTAPASKVLGSLRRTTLREKGKQGSGNFLFSYNKSSKLIGWVEYSPNSSTITFD
jgi:hypothetical protein